MSASSSYTKSRIALQWVEGAQAQGKAPLQEDYFEVNPSRGIFLLADGFGGSSGKIASEFCVKTVRQFLEQEAGDLDATLPFEIRPYYSLAGNVLYNAVSIANQKLIQKFKGKSSLEAGGASLIAGYLEGKLLALANVGACTVFLFRNGRAKELVTPKTLARQTNPFEDENPGIPASDRFVPLMSLGTVKQLEPEITEVEIKAGDQLCFHTAGLSQAQREAIFKLKSSSELSQFIDSSAKTANQSVIWVHF